MFISANRRGSRLIIPMSAVVSATGGKDGWSVRTTDGVTHAVDDISWGLAVEASPGGMIPAQPGTYLLEEVTDRSDDSAVYRHSVLGWAIGLEGSVRPVVVDTTALIESVRWAVEQPDGRVEGNLGEQWDTVEAWLASSRNAVTPPSPDPRPAPPAA